MGLKFDHFSKYYTIIKWWSIKWTDRKSNKGTTDADYLARPIRNRLWLSRTVSNRKIIDLFSKNWPFQNVRSMKKKWKWTSYANRTVQNAKINCPEKCNTDVKLSDYNLVQKRFDPKRWIHPENDPSPGSALSYSALIHPL